MKNQKLFSLLMSAGVLVLPLCTPCEKALANDTSSTSEAVTYPYQHTFVISAYYSPIENQKKYVTGSYKGDIRLNGHGVHGADGSDVYPGMIAAPKNYPFGTKLKIPGVGIATVHDRGGAIVNAGQRNQAHDRLDVWMGYGDAGLQRALKWGRRTVEVTVYGVDPSIKDNVYFEGYSEAESVAEQATGEAPKTFVEDLSVNDKNDGVKKLQEGLKQLGYYSGDSSGDYDDATRKAVIKFQVAAGLIDDENDFGSGYFGPQTRKLLEDALKNKNMNAKNKSIFQTPLSKDDQGDDVRKLQESLQKLGYSVSVTGIYDEQTIDAIFKFQRDHNVVSSEADFGAGVFGPKTMQVLASNLSESVLETANADQTSISPVIVFRTNLKIGDKGDDVRRLQEELKRLNYLGIEPSGYYGEVTEHAVMKFQESQGLIGSERDQAAGYFGEGTRNKIHEIIAQREHVSSQMAAKNPAKKEENVALK